MIAVFSKIILAFSFIILLFSCSFESPPKSTVYTGDYRFYANIGEFFDCETQHKYYLAPNSVSKALATKFLALKLPEKEDAFLQIEGYLIKESPEESLIPTTVFVPTQFISFNSQRGCQESKYQG